MYEITSIAKQSFVFMRVNIFLIWANLHPKPNTFYFSWTEWVPQVTEFSPHHQTLTIPN
jgi:hypothetical protein